MSKLRVIRGAMRGAVRAGVWVGPMAAAMLTASCTASPAPSRQGSAEKPDGAAVRQPGAIHPHATMLRFPAVSATHIAFVYANDVWLVPRSGGTATPLAGPPGMEMYPKFSPDGATLAFIGNYDGNRDIYTVPAAGGIATRVTHHPAGEELCGWTPDGKVLFLTNGVAGLSRQTQLFTVPPTGGLPEQVGVPYSGFAAISDDGQWLAMTPYSIDNRTWKRYRGGMATDLWLVNLKTHESKRITDWEGTDTLPMWHGTDVYYLSDAGPQHRLNIWKYDTKTGKNEQVTTFADDDVRWPSIGPGNGGQGEIVFQLGSQIRLLDLGTRQVASVDIAIPGDRPTLRQRNVDAADTIRGASLSPGGKRVAIEARGDLWSNPAREGAVQNLTRTDNIFERDPSWSPDGKSIAYFSDRTGEYELWVMPASGRGEARKLTDLGPGFRYNPVWSPDSKLITFTDKAGGLWLCTVESGELKQIDTDPWANRMSTSWSHDSAWLAYARADDENAQGCMWLYNVASGEKTRVTSPMFDSDGPAFDRKGEMLYFRTTREFESPIYGETDASFVYAGTQILAAAPLRADVKSPFAPKNDSDDSKDKEKKDKKGDKDGDGKKKDDEGKKDDGAANGDQPAGDAKGGEEKKDEGKEDDKDKKKDEKKKEPITIDLDGFEGRCIKVPVPAGVFGGIGVSDSGKLVYVRRTPRGISGDPSVMIFDPGAEKKEEKTVVAGVGAFDLSADGKKLLAYKGGKTMAVIDPAAGQDLSKPVVTGGMLSAVDPRAEWNQIFADAWRLERDFFYDPNMHGVNWPKMRDHYGPMIDDCASRQDVGYVIGELISELNVGHAYVTSLGDTEDEPRTPTGLLGCDFELGQKDGATAYRISRIYGGAPWDIDSRGPLAEPGLGVKVGDFLLAVDGEPVDTAKDPWAALVGTAGRTVVITVSENAAIDDTARDVVVKPISNEAAIRYRSWVEQNRQHVFEASGGKVGYIHVPDTGVNGQNELVRQFYGQRMMDALIIDDRWNGGGQIPTRFIELLNRPASNYWARRDGNDWPWPNDAHFGPKCMLINGRAGSGGDAFPAYFKARGLGKLIGLRTWGGLVGISGNPGLIDGGTITVPTFGYYKLNSTWGIEGHGVDPDIQVFDDPGKMASGADPQLDAGVAQMLKELSERPFVKPKRPAYPDRSGMGIPDQDK
ncbi:MAG: PDZ domain-containing protein [Phycisphaeraceae bacterium]|nr:PDZ domain-containing protein [Phycisphaeraceae bacterium]